VEALEGGEDLGVGEGLEEEGGVGVDSVAEGEGVDLVAEGEGAVLEEARSGVGVAEDLGGAGRYLSSHR
jgi:hypothetical protein